MSLPTLACPETLLRTLPRDADSETVLSPDRTAKRLPVALFLHLTRAALVMKEHAINVWLYSEDTRTTEIQLLRLHLVKIPFFMCAKC